MEWATVTIDDIKAASKHSLVGGPFGTDLVISDYVEEGVPVIRGVNLSKDGLFSEHDFVFVREEKADALVANNAYPGDLIVTQRGTLGQVSLIPKNSQYQRFVISQSQMKLTVSRDKADPRYVYYFFRSPNTVQKLKNHAISSGVPHINLGILKHLEIPLPSLETQRKLASTLSAYDDLIENNLRRIALLEEAARLLYKEWFVRLRFPGYEHTRIVEGVPEEWKRVSAYDVMDVMSGGTPKTSDPEYWDGDIPFYTPKDAAKTCYVLQTEKTITEKGLSKCNSKLYPKNTVFITARGTVGNINIAQKPMAMNQTSYALRGKADISQFFLFCALRAAVDHFRHRAVGAVFNAIVVDTFKRIPFLKPDTTLIVAFEREVEPLFGLIENLLVQNQRLRKARDLLLPGLMSGELEV